MLNILLAKDIDIDLGKLRKSAEGFIGWWRSELTAMLPAALYNRIKSKRQRIVIKIEGHNIVVTGSGNGESVLLGQGVINPDGSSLPDSFPSLAEAYDPESTDTIVSLPDQKILQTTVTLPVEAMENLREVLGYEIDRQTPFQLEQVYYDYDLQPHRSGQQQISVKLLVVPRKTMDPLLEVLEKWGLQPGQVTTATYLEQLSDRKKVPNLLPPARTREKNVNKATVNRLLVISAICLALATLLLPLYQQRSTIRNLEVEIETRQAEAEASRVLLDELNRLVPETRFAWKRKLQAILVIELLNELSVILPDDTWLQRIEIAGTTVKLQGTSSSASALIGILENSTMIQNAVFVTAVARDPRTGKERFQISADVSIKAVS